MLLHSGMQQRNVPAPAVHAAVVRYSLLLLALLSFSNSYIAMAAQQHKWYYTGEFKSDQANGHMFRGAHSFSRDLFNPGINNNLDSRFSLYCGQVLLNMTSRNVSNDVRAAVSVELLEHLGAIEQQQHQLSHSLAKTSTVNITSAATYGLVLSVNYGHLDETLTQAEMATLLPVQFEIGLFDHLKNEFGERKWINVTIGTIEAVTAERNVCADSSNSNNNHNALAVDIGINGDSAMVQNNDKQLATSNTQCAVVAAAAVEEHRLMFTTDSQKRRSLIEHTWDYKYESFWSLSATQRLEGNNIIEDNLELQQHGSSSKRVYKKTFRMMTFNLWHNNPPKWVYHNPMQRWTKYVERMKHFADVVAAEDPDFLVVQEVRLDTSFYDEVNGYHHWSNPSDDRSVPLPQSFDSGSQVDHLLYYLAQARLRLCVSHVARASFSSSSSSSLPSYCETVHSSTVDSSSYYQFVFRPGMSMVERRRYSARNEEGVLILSKFPIVDSKAIYMPREVGNKEDDHQRVLLVVKAKVYLDLDSPDDTGSADDVHNGTGTGTGNGGTARTTSSRPYTTVDIMSSHFSLSEISRDRTVRHIRDSVTGHVYTDTDTDTDASSISGTTSHGEGGSGDVVGAEDDQHKSGDTNGDDDHAGDNEDILLFVNEGGDGGMINTGAIKITTTSSLSVGHTYKETKSDISNRLSATAAIARWDPAPVQLLAGDFNAEPEEAAMQFLMDDKNFACPLSCGHGDDIMRTCSEVKEEGSSAFVDAWVTSAARSTKKSSSNELQEERAPEFNDDIALRGLTFPSCNPIKRIDFILVRNHSAFSCNKGSMAGTSQRSKTSVSVRRTEVVGKEPTEDSAHLVGSRDGLGMLDLDSPVWASDHFAVVSDLDVVVTELPQ